MSKRILLCIMDGWGISCGNEETNAVKLANPVNFYKLKETEKYTYKGKAHLNNGNSLDIWIEYYDKTKYIEVSLE